MPQQCRQLAPGPFGVVDVVHAQPQKSVRETMEFPQMSENLSPEVRARAMASTVLRVCRTGSTQVQVATSMGISETLLSNMLTKDLDRWCLLMATLDLKIVSASMKCYPADYMNALHVLARVKGPTSHPHLVSAKASEVCAQLDSGSYYGPKNITVRAPE